MEQEEEVVLYGTGGRNGVIRNKTDSVVCSRMEGWFLMEQEGVKVFLWNRREGSCNMEQEEEMVFYMEQE